MSIENKRVGGNIDLPKIIETQQFGNLDNLIPPLSRMDSSANQAVDSDDELYFSWWLDELIESGYVESYKREPTQFKLSDIVKFSFVEVKQLKTKVKTTEKESTLIREHIYTPDFEVIWTVKAIGIFIEKFPYITNNNMFVSLDYTTGGYYTYIENKPIFDQNNMSRLFQINKKWVYEKYKEYINEVEFSKLFKNTFTPKRFLLTNKTKKIRTINFKVRTLNEFINETI